MRFGLFFMSEFIEVVVIAGPDHDALPRRLVDPVAARTQTIIGAITPVFDERLRDRPLHRSCTSSTFMLKVVVMIWLQMPLRWTLPRFRYDQVMDLCWKIMLPLSIANILVTGFVILLVRGARVSAPAVLFYLFAALAVISALGMVLNVRNTVAAAMSLVVTMVALAVHLRAARGAPGRGDPDDGLRAARSWCCSCSS